MIILGATSREVACEWVPDALSKGALVIDNSSAYRMEDGVPLVVPQVNPGSIEDHHRLIANPNCSTIQLVMALAPLLRLSPAEWVSVSTYQSVSGAGGKGIEALLQQEKDGPRPGGFHRNVICEIGEPDGGGYTPEEMKLVHETSKILGGGSPAIFPSCARVPVAVGHTESVTVKFTGPVTAAEAAGALSAFPGVTTSVLGREPLTAAGTDETFVGRIRNHPTDPTVLQFWVTADNVRKGAALNAVQILELLAARRT